MIIDPPFRWFTPRDMTEAAATDEGYRGVARFFAGVDQRLRPGGRILLFFGTSGDQEHVVGLAERSGLRPQVVASRDLTQDDVTVTYSTFRLERADSLSEDLSQPRGRAGVAGPRRRRRRLDPIEADSADSWTRECPVPVDLSHYASLVCGGSGRLATTDRRFAIRSEPPQPRPTGRVEAMRDWTGVLDHGVC